MGLLTLSTSELHDRIAAGDGVSAGAVIALEVAAAAGLVAMVARASTSWPEASGVAAQAERLRERAAPLAERNADALVHARAELKRAADPEIQTSNGNLGAALRDALAVPLELAFLACDVALLADHVAQDAVPALRPDAVVAAVLASAAAAGATHLVEVNLTISGDDDSRVLRARTASAAAADAARRVLSRGRC